MAAFFSFTEVLYSRQRRHSALAYLTPDEYERETLHACRTTERQMAS